MRLFLAILVGRLISYLTRTLKIGGGSAAPGLYALKIYPELVTGLVQKIPKNVVITGTNGKTTTARMLAHFAKESGLKVIGNHTGSNLERGIVSTLITHTREGLARLNYDLGIWELDEAAFNSVAPKLNPDIVVFLNVFRDQLDRYGEVDTLVKKWCQTLGEIDKETLVIINGDDTNTLRLKSCFKGIVETFGVENYKIIGESLEFLKEQENLDFEAKNVKLNGLKGTSFSLYINHLSSTIQLPIPGVYHIYDFLAAFASGISLGFEPHDMTSSIRKFFPAFGRVEKLDFGYIFLIKNPAGATQVFETIAPHLKKSDRLLIALNDNLADGTDISWIWDAEFEKLVKRKKNQKSAGVNTNPPQGWMIIASGTRAYDLANRLKYAGFDPKLTIVEEDLKKALQLSKEGLKGQLFILPTYTAMLELQSILTKSGLKKHYWEEA